MSAGIVFAVLREAPSPANRGRLMLRVTKSDRRRKPWEVARVRGDGYLIPLAYFYDWPTAFGYAVKVKTQWNSAGRWNHVRQPTLSKVPA